MVSNTCAEKRKNLSWPEKCKIKSSCHLYLPNSSLQLNLLSRHKTSVKTETRYFELFKQKMITLYLCANIV